MAFFSGFLGAVTGVLLLGVFAIIIGNKDE